MYSGLVDHFGAIAGRMAYVFAVALLVSASVAHSQVIKEGGFPVKGGGVSGEPFSLSCPPRLYVAAGESVLFSCSATAVPEEGVRYAWEAVSGDGLRLLSDAQALDPLFTAPLSETREEYGYRLTAMSAGFYRTATVAVSVGGFVKEGQEAFQAPAEECGSFGGFGRDQEGCQPWEKAPSPDSFGDVPEEEGIVPWPSFPEAPGAEDKEFASSSGAGPFPQAPPRLECPVAVFLEELETGAIECRAWDASGEEYLEYSWEPVGSTTRDYLENPRLMPEDSPNPSVVAPEAPAYETLESFRSVEPTFRYRYRLTATSRATGLSSSSEVEVFVSSSRPGVYCPLEVEVAEGESIALDCEGVDPLSSRMDYDEDGASIEWEWEGLWGASTALLDATDRSSPLFTAPAGSAGEEYHYIASMTSSSSGLPRTARRRVTVRVVGEEDVSGPTDAPYIECPDDPFERYEGEALTVSCRRDFNVSTHYITMLMRKTVASSPWATFYWFGASSGPIIRLRLAWFRGDEVISHAPQVDEDTEYIFTIRICPESIADPCSASAAVASDAFTVIILDGTRLAVTCNDPDPVYEGAADFTLDCSVTNEPSGATYAWTARGSTANTDDLSSTTILKPTFDVPDDVDADTDYDYTVTLSASGIDDVTEDVTVTVLNRGALSVVCADPGSVYEGSADILFDCSASGVSSGTGYAYSWTARGNTQDTSLLSAADIASPTFAVPDDVAATATYEYLLTVSSANAEAATAEVTVTVLNRGALAVVCADPGSVYEGSADVAFDCEASGVSSGTGYAYSWTARGNTQDTSLLSAVDISSPTFHVPYAVDEDETYEYRLTVSAANAESSSARVTVTVLNKGALSVACADPGSVYEGSADVAFDCEASGAPSGSYYTYVWTASGDTQDTSLLSAADISSPTFHVPYAVDEDETYEYRLTVSAANAESSSARVTVTVLNKGALSVACADPGSVYEGSADVAFDCEASGAPSGSYYTYVWTASGDTQDTSLLSAADISSPTFHVPYAVDEDETYEYRLTVSAANAESSSARVTVTVLNKGALSVACADPGSVYEGSADVAFDCEASGAPSGSYYTYVWTASGDTQDTSLLSAADISSPTFHVPEEVDEDGTYEYLLTVSAANAKDASAAVTVTVLNKGALALVCADISPEVYEGSEDIELDCEASGAPAGSAYEYVWTARGDTPNTDLLSATDMASPAFAVPEEVDEDETYEYLLTVSAENAKDAAAAVTVTVLNKGALTVVCVDPGSVYEGSEDVTFDCSASGAPGDNPEYAYAWTARGDTPNTDLLSATDMASPTFAVPEEVDEDETYEYLLTVSAANAEDASAEVSVTVLNKGALAVVCTDPGSVYEGSADFTLDCEASGAPAGSAYEYVWTARGDTQDTALLSATDMASPTFAVPEEVDEDETYEYLLTVSAANAEDAAAAVTVTVLNKGALALVCADISPEVYEGSEDIELDCEASGAPAGSAYEYVWTARGDTQDTALLSATDMASPTFAAPEEVDEDETYEYLLTVSAENAEDASAAVTVTVLNKGALAVVCVDPGSVYEGSEDVTFDCSASGAPGDNPEYAYAWTARGSTSDTSLLSSVDISSPTFHVPEEVDEDETYEYLLTVSAVNAEDAAAEVTVTVLNKGALAVVCADPGSVYEGSEDVTFDCSASGAPGDNPEYAYAWTARGDTQDTALLSATDMASPTFAAPEEVDEDETYEYLLTVSAANAEDAAAEVSVTVLNKGALAAVCADPGSVYEGSADFTLDCSASGAPGDNPEYAYAWTARGSTTDTSLLSAVDIVSPVFFVPDEVDEDETYEYLLTVSAANAEDATAEVTVTVLDRAVAPPFEPVSPPLASSSAREPSALGVTVSVSSLRFGVQSADTQASLDPVTDQLSTRVSGPYHVGRMTLSPGGSEETRENGEMDLSIELASPVVLRREGGVEAASIILAPLWSLSESCEQLSSQAIGSLYTEVTLSDAGCRLLRFGGELDLTDVSSGRYTGSLDIILRSGESEETHSVEVDVTVIPAQRVITIGPGGVRFSTSRELPAGLTEEQNLSIYPHVAFLTGEKPHGVFELSNPSLIPLEISVSARFGYTEATENGREVVVEDASGSHLGDLSKVVDIHPGVLVLQPGEKGLVRYGLQEGALAAMADKGYATFFDVVSSPRQYVRSDRMPEEVAGDRTARVTMRVPGVYVPGEGASQLRAALLSISYVGSLSATFLLETEDHPFAGEVVAYDGDGRELGRRETLVYTRSRVRVPLDRMPEEGAVFLRFAPWGSGRVPEPASVEWDAPRRDIGAADKDRTRIPETLVQRP